MKKSLFANLAVLIGVGVYYFLFWQERMGVNVLIFSLLIQGVLLYLQPESRSKREVLITGVGTFLTALLVVFHNSLLVKIIHVLSLSTFVGFTQQYELRFIFYAFLLYLHNMLRVPLAALQHLRTQSDLNYGMQRLRYSLNVTVIPIIILLVFYGIYYNANPKFAEVSNSFWTSFLELFQWNISLEKTIFILTGVFILGGIFWHSGGERLAKRQLKQVENLVRKRKDRAKQLVRLGVIDLKKEYQSGLILVIALDILLVIVNALDIRHVWFGEQPDNPLTWKNYVHEGTYLLIGAILLAMGILVVLFRKNINFFPKNEALKIAAYVWIIQNALLAISVGVRNWRYVEHCGLAYKRIGVFLFLMLVLFGLYSMFIKVKDRKSFYFLLHRNSWAMYAILIAATFVNWDVFITKYNLNHHAEEALDVAFLMDEVSDKNLSLLFDNQEFIVKKGKWELTQLQKDLANKKRQFNEKIEEGSWKSWNYMDWKNAQKLKGM